MKKLICLLVASVVAMAGSQSIFARSLSADEALSLVASKMRHLAAGERSMHLALELKASGTDANTVYVFASQSGFAVVAADDVVDNLLLGYSDDGVFDPANIPPAMQWYLDECSASIERCVKEDAEGIARMARRDAPQRTPIAPLVQTKWNQDAPYNNMCPIVNNGRSVTGCVATAMAQVMRVHQWPEQGVGSHEYSWTVNNVTYTTSADFGSTTYDWANMLNVYDANATADQNDAVATLMYHCGVAADMGYTPSESGASDLTAGVGMIKYFNYDKGMQYLAREWYTLDEWNDLVYEELSNGSPLLYGGSDITGAGHEFVCDGYSTDDYFHINWGWGGYADGYFILPDLNPNGQGIGGGSGQSGFNFRQSVIAGIQKPVEGSKLVHSMTAYKGYSTTKGVYSKSEDILFDMSLFSTSLGTITTRISFHLVGDGIDSYVPFSYVEIGCNQGWYTLSKSAGSFPNGTYRVTLEYTDADGNWQPVHYNKTTGAGYFNFEVTDTQVIINKPATGFDISAELVSITPDVASDGDVIYNGHSYNVAFDITSTGSWEGYLQAILLNKTEDAIVVAGDTRYVSINGSTVVNESFKLPIPSGLAAGTYYMVLTNYTGDGYYYFKSLGYEINVTEFVTSGEVETPSVSVGGVSLSPYYDYQVPTFKLGNLKFDVTLTCKTAPLQQEVQLYYGYITEIFETSATLTLNILSEQQVVSMNTVGEQQTLTFANPYTDVVDGRIYLIRVDVGNNAYGYYFFKLEKAVVLNDGEPYDNATDIEGIKVDYVRKFNNTEWQPLYVPFNLSYDEWSAEGAEVARLSGVHEYDDNNDGTVDRRVIEFLTVTSGDINPNVPYVIKSNSTDEVTFHGKGKTLKAAPASEGSVDCSSTTHAYYLKGIYQPKTDIAITDDIFVMSDGKFGHTSQTLKPNRFYLQRMTKSNSGYLGSTAPDLDEVIYISVNGQICGTIDSLIDANDVDADAPLYDLMGRPVANPQPGLYIRGGKKVYVK